MQSPEVCCVCLRLLSHPIKQRSDSILVHSYAPNSAPNPKPNPFGNIQKRRGWKRQSDERWLMPRMKHKIIFVFDAWLRIIARFWRFEWNHIDCTYYQTIAVHSQSSLFPFFWMPMLNILPLYEQLIGNSSLGSHRGFG